MEDLDQETIFGDAVVGDSVGMSQEAQSEYVTMMRNVSTFVGEVLKINEDTITVDVVHGGKFKSGTVRMIYRNCRLVSMAGSTNGGIFGLHVIPKVGSSVLCVFIAGTLMQPAVLGQLLLSTDSASISSRKGENVIEDVVLINGNVKVRAKNSGDVEIQTTATKVTIKANGDIELGSGVLESIMKGNTFQGLYNAHTHADPSSGFTGPPVVPLIGTELSTKVKTS